MGLRLGEQELEVDMGLYWPELTLLPHPLLRPPGPGCEAPTPGWLQPPLDPVPLEAVLEAELQVPWPALLPPSVLGVQ